MRYVLYILVFIALTPLLVYLLSFLAEYVKLTITSPKEVMVRLKEKIKRLKGFFIKVYANVLLFVKLIKASLIWLEEKFYKLRYNIKKIGWKSPSRIPLDEESTELEPITRESIFTVGEIELKDKTKVTNEHLDSFGNLNALFVENAFKMLELHYVPERLYKLCFKLPAQKALRQYLGSINFSFEDLVNSASERNRFADILDLIIEMENEARIGKLSDEPFYFLLRDKGITREKLQEKIENYKIAAEINRAIEEEEIIFFDFRKFFVPKAIRIINMWEEKSTKKITRLYDNFLEYWNDHLLFLKYKGAFAKILGLIEEVEVVETYQELLEEVIEEIKIGQLPNRDFWEAKLFEYYSDLHKYYKKHYSSGKSERSSSGSSGGSSTGSGSKTEKSEFTVSRTKTREYTQDWFDKHYPKTWEKDVHAAFRIIGIDSTENDWSKVKITN